MNIKSKPAYYRMELDDYSAAAFTSFGKYYYGELEDLRGFFSELAHDELFKDRFKELISTFQAFEEGQQNLKHHVAYSEVPFLVPVRLLHKEKLALENYAWEHLNTWECPYYMRCDKVESEHLWLACGGEFCRATKAVFTNLQYTGHSGVWKDIGSMLWGFPCILTGNSSGLWNRLAEPEKYFKTRAEAQQDWAAFLISPDPNYSEFCNDIFGDG
ncbi:MAG: hypothetical protein E7445_08875 [Ruminococcaceae bacterium]|nr:hypothetical protein [Oscillospiraceae bacterium]